MTDSNNSDLFGNNDDVYPNKRQYDELEPYVVTESPTLEPLFPASSTPASSVTPSIEEHSWLEATPESIVYDYSHQSQTYDEQSYSNVNLDAVETPPAQEISKPRETETNDIYSLSPQEAAQWEIAQRDVAAVRNAAPDNTTLDSTTVDHTARDNTARHVPHDLSSHVDSARRTSVDHPSAVKAKAHVSEPDALFNRHFAVLTDLMQHGAWPQALEKLQAMRTEFPNVAALDVLLDEATLKTELMMTWTHKIKGRRLTVGQEWLLRRSLPFMLLFALFISGAVFYQNFIAPSRQVMAMERANQALIEEATGLLQVGQVDASIGLYELVLSRNPDNSAAQQGLRDAESLSGVAATYDVAIRVANSGNLKRSLRLLQSVKTQSPSFRDIDARLARVSSLLDAEYAYQLAEKAFVQHRWTDAITHYEETRLLASDYQAVRVSLQLSAAYFMAAQRFMTQWPTPEYTTEQVRDFLRRAMEVNGQDESLRFFLTQLDDFIQGERALNNDNLDQAVKLWRKLYDAQPDFLGGYLAEQLYRAYLALAAKVRNSDAEYARELYTLAATLPVHDSGEARTQLRNLGAATPVAQPTPTPRPTVAYVAAAAPAVAAIPPTPVPTAAPANDYQGWIAFRSTRDGGEQVYIMRGNGSEQQLAPEELRGQLDVLYQNERRSSDGQLAYVQAATGRSDANIYVTSADGVNKREVTNYNGDEYDPVWSPTGDRLAFVANHTSNDEIWVMRADGSEARQLTNNNWEWDKHPTWSPDGSEIAFFSNRSGQRQIWVMGSDGSYQRNLSSNGYDDWDPVWIK